VIHHFPGAGSASFFHNPNSAVTFIRCDIKRGGDCSDRRDYRPDKLALRLAASSDVQQKKQLIADEHAGLAIFH
jgi:hypothetical protein